jgi:hypothetical protein
MLNFKKTWLELDLGVLKNELLTYCVNLNLLKERIRHQVFRKFYANLNTLYFLCNSQLAICLFEFPAYRFCFPFWTIVYRLVVFGDRL